MMDRTDLTGKLALDANALGKLRQGARENSPEALRGAATQFEALFINMMMKSMRDAVPQDGMMDNEQTKMFTTMLDGQLSQNLAKRGIGLADVLVRQLSANQQAQALGASGEGGASEVGGAHAALAPAAKGMRAAYGAAMKLSAEPPFAAGAAAPHAGTRRRAEHVKSFQDRLGAEAEQASQATGIPARFMLGQAALESGWGKREIRNADGSTSHNLFGIKAGADWKGKVTLAVTTEYVNGAPHRKVEKFRAYDSYADSFKDYARLIANNPRYRHLMDGNHDAASFAHGLQKAGYATDPAYAAKLTSIIRHSLAS